MIPVFTSDAGYFPSIDYTGAVTEKGIGEGVNTNFNYPLLLDTQDIDCTPIYGREDTDHTFY